MYSIIILGLFIVSYIISYNVLVGLKQKALQAWSGIDVQLRRRHDLIPQLIKTIEGYMRQEKSILMDVTELRTRAVAASLNQEDDLGQIENSLNARLTTVFALTERYPDLKSDTHFLKLQEELSETEDQIAASRNIFNSNAANFNTARESFPTSIVAFLHRFKKMNLFVD